MFTQCSNCNTVFELSAEVLRAAGGQVRCGRCGAIFNALARLAEDAASFEIGESAFDLEERADSILESEVAEQVLQASPDAKEEEEEFGGVEIAQLQVLDFSDEHLIDESVEDVPCEPDRFPDVSLEYTLPPTELDRIFIESSVGIFPPFEPHAFEPTALEPPALEPTALEPPMVETLDLEPHPSQPEPLLALRDDEDEPLDIEVISDDRSVPVRPQLSPLAELGTFDLSEPPAGRAGSFAEWVAAATAAALLLVAQVVHHNRDVLTARGPLAPLLRAVYAKLGAPLGGAPNLGAFQLRQWGVTGEPGSDATLRVRASILNTTSQLQPFPMLRVTLANRYGTHIGTRDFEPREYLGKPMARPLSPGETVDAVLDILDPGKEAEGFEIDVCLRSDRKIVCANDATPARAGQ